MKRKHPAKKTKKPVKKQAEKQAKKPAKKTNIKTRSVFRSASNKEETMSGTSIVAVGSMAFDSIETPFGKVSKVLGGSANYFSLSASYFANVRCVSVVGKDYPQAHLSLLKEKGIRTEGIRVESGRTFHWSGAYSYDLNEAKTLTTELNVFEAFNPDLPTDYRTSEFVFLGNISPQLQMHVLDQVQSPKFVAIDTMNFWIEGSRELLIKAISRCDALIINEGEIRQLSQQYNLVQAAETIQKWGPQTVVVKRGEYGAILFHKKTIFTVPALPLSEVKDPTGAGDTFAGGFMGYLASQRTKIDESALKQAIIYGNVMASFTVQDFGFSNLLQLSKTDITSRYKKVIALTQV